MLAFNHSSRFRLEKARTGRRPTLQIMVPACSPAHFAEALNFTDLGTRDHAFAICEGRWRGGRMHDSSSLVEENVSRQDRREPAYGLRASTVFLSSWPGSPQD